MAIITIDKRLGWIVSKPPEVQGIDIGKGGEALTDNTYGIEIEFCTHDSVIFAFTHIVAGVFNITGTLPWKLESDSGNVFELVTPPLPFETIQGAYAFKGQLVAMLQTSIQSARTQGINAITLGDWALQFGPKLVELLNTHINTRQLKLQPVELQPVGYSSWEKVGEGLNVGNVDDGINIPAALLRHKLREPDWESYTPGIVLARCSKFWSEGYASQMNLPMTLSGYFLYMMDKTHDVTYSHAVRVQKELKDEKSGQKLTAWYWRHVLLQAWCRYQHLLGKHPTDEDLFSPDAISRSALLYLVVGKLLTGALAELGETPQLELQQLAWDAGSTRAIDADEPEVIHGDWAAYHSALKDLTGIWLKASLLDVMRTQNLQTYSWAVTELPSVLATPEVWQETLLEWKGMKRITEMGSTIEWTDLEDFAEPERRAVLCEKIIAVAGSLATRLKQLDPDIPGPPDLPDETERPFLDRRNTPPWEARYDTLLAPIPPRVNTRNEFTYLVEHRNH
ncbi:hypothetical protein [Stenotrophomonas maltophilia]|uniref:hypothetical protein n=1 Tax=Stenotrophomonas maltophilia TaxID=40324 RepID=UPI000D0D30CC|nr:hypothetical protein [Stenotrophomonas maltophilia]PSM15591.1 hypothetical protein CV100_00175 [Stenotrophomonas maltophilia]